MTELMQASNQWMSRPADERFTSLTEMHSKLHATRLASTQSTVSTRQIEVVPHSEDPVRGISVQSEHGVADPSNWAFNQLASLAGAPASYLRKLPAPIVADAMNYGLRFNRDAEDVKLLRTATTRTVPGAPLPREVADHAIAGTDRLGYMPDKDVRSTALRAATGANYGRVWNDDIVSALIGKFGDGITGDFRVPGEFGKRIDVTNQNTTLFGSDRDIFVFLADEENRVEMSNRRDGQSGSLARGFFVWNSEEGSKSIGAAFFLFDYACSNRIVWGAQDFTEMRLRHTSSAPDRWLEEITPVLSEYANASALPIQQTIAEAQQKRVDDDLEKFLMNRFTKSETTAIKAAHEREEGRPIETVWDAVTGVTAHAKTISHQDNRVDMERKGGKLLDLVAA